MLNSFSFVFAVKVGASRLTRRAIRAHFDRYSVCMLHSRRAYIFDNEIQKRKFYWSESEIKA